LPNLRALGGEVDDRRTPDLDRHIGARLRERRILLGMTQQDLGNLIGLTPQQVHKYETGQDSITVARLWALAGELGAGVNYFFHRMGEEPCEGSAHQQRTLLELCRHFTRIDRPEHRASICEMVRVLSSAEPASSSELTTE
jgi:transcriptional regulator with XRE-family HTH domain